MMITGIAGVHDQLQKLKAVHAWHLDVKGDTSGASSLILSRAIKGSTPCPPLRSRIEGELR